MIKVGDVVQFNGAHKWYGSLGIVTRAKPCGTDTKYMIGVPIPQKGTAYIFSMASVGEIERIGEAAFVPED